MNATTSELYRELGVESSNLMLEADARRVLGRYEEAAHLLLRAGQVRERMGQLCFDAEEFAEAAEDWLSSLACFIHATAIEPARAILGRLRRLWADGKIPPERADLAASLREQDQAVGAMGQRVAEVPRNGGNRTDCLEQSDPSPSKSVHGERPKSADGQGAKGAAQSIGSWVDPRITSVRIDAVKAYLLGHGWRLSSDPSSRLLVFEGTLDDDGQLIVQVLPASAQMEDYRLRLEELLGALSVLEHRPAQAILSDILALQSRTTNGDAGASSDGAKAETDTEG